MGKTPKTMKSNAPTRLVALKATLLPLALAALVAISPWGYAQTGPGPQNSDQYEQLSPDALDELVAPFALYPDALIALILPASTVPSDLTLASRYLANGGAGFETQSWDDSVISLSRYPEVVTWMDENLAWTTAVGSAFVAQPVDVMNSVQRLRAAAAAAGNLDDTPEQRVVREVVEETTYIRIVPAQPNVIYVPTYDPVVVYYPQPPNYVGNVINFGFGFAMGSWLNYDCDWGRRGIYRGDYNPGWNHYGGRGGGDRVVVQNNTEVNVTNITNTSANLWQPGTNSRRQLSRKKDNYNQRVRAANQEVRTARRQAAGKPDRVARQLEALPQPAPMVADGKKGKNRAQAIAANPNPEVTRKSDAKMGLAESPNLVAPGAASPITRPADAPKRQGKSKAQLPTDAPVVDTAATAEAKTVKAKPSPSKNTRPNTDQPDNKKQTVAIPRPTLAPEGKRSMKKDARPATKPDSNKKEKAQPGMAPETRKEKKSAGKPPSFQPSTAPTVPRSTRAPQVPTQVQESRADKAASQRNAPPSQKKVDRPKPTPQAPAKSESDRKAPTQVTAPRPSQVQPPPRVNAPQPKKMDRPSAPSQAPKQKAPDRKVKNQDNRQAPAAPAQPQPQRESKSERKQPQAAQAKPPQPSTDGGAPQKQKK